MCAQVPPVHSIIIFIYIPISLQLGPVRPGGQLHRPIVVLQTPNSHSGLHSVIVKEYLNQQNYQQRIGKLMNRIQWICFMSQT